MEARATGTTRGKCASGAVEEDASWLRWQSNAFFAGGAVVLASWLVFGAAVASWELFVPVAGALALVMGLPHGALDLWISRRAGLWYDTRSFVRFHALYLGVAALVVVAFLLAPAVSLALFLAMSVFHFSHDWEGAVSMPVRLLAAALIVIVPSLAHPQAVADIFAALTRTASPRLGELPFQVMLPTMWLAAGTCAAALFQSPRAGLEIALLCALAVALPPIAFFFAYFVLMHSPRHMLHERGVVQGRGEAWGVALYTGLALALVFAATLAVFGPSMSVRGWAAVGDEAAVLRAVFIGLAALTLPHVLLVERARVGRSMLRDRPSGQQSPRFPRS